MSFVWSALNMGKSAVLATLLVVNIEGIKASNRRTLEVGVVYV